MERTIKRYLSYKKRNEIDLCLCFLNKDGIMVIPRKRDGVKMKLLCIGDSLTFGYGVRTFQRWTRLCAQETGWEIVNEGISGDTTGGMLVRLRALLAERDICVQRPLVLLMGGANDIFFSGTDTGARANMGAMLNQLLSLGVHTIIGIPTPEGHQIMARRLCAHLKRERQG